MGVWGGGRLASACLQAAGHRAGERWEAAKQEAIEGGGGLSQRAHSNLPTSLQQKHTYCIHVGRPYVSEDDPELIKPRNEN